ncbi:MAG: hypothetical protein HC844_15830, partial [Tabrizicola sp.]|nr:hypothetical protein [Tabrizicola sp.]
MRRWRPAFRSRASRHLQRLAIAEATRFPEIARAVDRSDAKAAFLSVVPVLEAAMAESELRSGDAEIAHSQFFEMCFGKRLRDVMMGLANVPSKDEIERDVRLAVDVFFERLARANANAETAV